MALEKDPFSQAAGLSYSFHCTYAFRHNNTSLLGETRSEFDFELCFEVILFLIYNPHRKPIQKLMLKKKQMFSIDNLVKLGDRGEIRQTVVKCAKG